MHLIGRRNSRRCTLINRRTEAPLCADVHVARTFLTRLLGLLPLRELQPNRGLWLQPSNGIHTMGMRFAIDVVGFDRNGVVVKTAESVQPWRIVGMPRGTTSVLELPAGHLQNNPVQLGDVAIPAYSNGTANARQPRSVRPEQLPQALPLAHQAC